MKEEESRLRSRRLWREYTDRVLTRCRQVDEDTAIETLIEEAKNSQEHTRRIMAEVLRLCPELTLGTLLDIINKQINVTKRKFTL